MVLETFPPHTHPLVSINEFLKPCNWLFLEFESFVKDWIEIEKNSLNNFTCHLSFLKKLSPIDTHPLISICEFLKPYDWLFLEFESFVKGWMWIEKDLLYNVICHLSFLKKCSPTHTHSLICIHEFLKPYNWLFLEFESFVKGWMWIGKKFSQ